MNSLNTRLRSLEDSFRPLLGPNYWILKRMGLILPENRGSKIAYVILHEIVTLFVFTQYMELYVIRSDLDLVLTNLKISMLSIVCIVKANTFVFWQAKWKDVIEYVTEADKYERDTRDEIKGKTIDAYTKYCRRILYFYWVLVFTTFITVITTPLVRYLSSENYREALKTELELFPHIFSSWMPFDKYHSPGCWITVLWHVLLCAYGAGIMAAYDTIIVVIMVFFGGKLELLRERCKQMFGNDGLGISEEEAVRIICQLHNTHVLLKKFCNEAEEASTHILCKCNALTHCRSRTLGGSIITPDQVRDLEPKNILRFISSAGLESKMGMVTIVFLVAVARGYSRLFNSLLSPVMFLYVVMCSLMLCASAFQLTTAQNATQTFLMAEYLIFGVAQLFMFCWHSNDVLVKSENVMLGPYESQWWTGCPRQRKYVLLLAGQLRLVHTYTAGPFTNLTISTFITILKGAYSYYTLLRK